MMVTIFLISESNPDPEMSQDSNPGNGNYMRGEVWESNILWCIGKIMIVLLWIRKHHAHFLEQNCKEPV